MTKNMPKCLKILCVGVFMTCFCMICMFICTRPREVEDTIVPVEDNSTEELGDLIEVAVYKEIFNGETDVDNYYLIGNTGYHIVISENTVTVNNNVIFKADISLLNVALYKDMFVIYSSNASDYTSNLTLIDMDGKVIKNVDNALIYYNFFGGEGNELSYAVDDYQYGKLDGNSIYRSHEITQYFISYSGDSNISERTSKYSTSVYTPRCLTDRCVLYEQDGLKIEIDSKNTRSLYINGNQIDKDYSLLKIEFLPDNYLFVTSCGMDGYGEFTYIADWNGNIVTSFSNLVGDDYYSSHPITSEIANSFSNGTFYINTVSGKAQSEIGQYFEGHDVFSDDYVIGRVWTFNYLGNGQVDDGYIIDNITVGDFNEYIKSKAQ